MTNSARIRILVVFSFIVVFLSVVFIPKNIFAQGFLFGEQGGHFIIKDRTDALTPTPLPFFELDADGGLSKGIINASQVVRIQNYVNGTPTPGMTFGGEVGTNPTPGNIYFAGNVGVGTTSANQKLNIQGDLNWSGNLYASGSEYRFYTDAGLPLALKTGSLAITSNYNTNPPINGLFVEGFIGIGTANPAQKIDIATGTLNTSGGMCISGVCKTDWNQVGGGLLPAASTGQTMRYDSSIPTPTPTGVTWAASSNLFNDGTNIGIGTTIPSTNLDIAGPVKARNFLTNSGYPVNDILFPQEIWNYSSNTLHGSTGLDYSRGWELKSGPTVFDNITVNDYAITNLHNGNMMIIYEGTSGYGYLAIRDSSGTQIKAPTAFTDYNTGGAFSAASFSNGNVLIAYRGIDGQYYGTFVIYDQNGIMVKGPTTFATHASGINGPSAASLTDGNVAIAYSIAGSNSVYKIFNSLGQEISSNPSGYTFTTDLSASPIHATGLPNGNIFIAYSAAGNPGKFSIVNTQGDKLVESTQFESDSIGSLSSAVFSNGNVLLAYSDMGNSSYGTYAIYDSNGQQIKAPTTYINETSGFLGATTLADDTVLIAYSNGSNLGYFQTFDSRGNVVVSATQFKNSVVYPRQYSVRSFTDGRFMIYFRDNGNNGYGTYVIYQSSQTKFNRDMIVMGNMGIGTSAPPGSLTAIGASAQFNLEGSSSHAAAIVKSYSSSEYASARLYNKSNTMAWELANNNSADSPNNRLLFRHYNGSSWSNPLVIDSSGNIGIGTGTPGYKLDLGAGQNLSHVKMGGAYLFSNAQLGISAGTYRDAAGSWYATSTSAYAWGTTASYMFWRTNTGLTVGNTYSPTDQMRLNSTGLAIGTNLSPSYKLHVAGTVYVSGSSLDYKKNITNLEIDSSLIYKLRPVSFDYKNEYQEFGKILGGGKQIGLIAEEVYKVIPELTIYGGDKIRNVDYEKLSILLLAELQKQKNSIQNIKEEKLSLIRRSENLKSTIEKLEKEI
jgi:hypothetical protein